nr:MAG TPA: hypothetical protein [Caudoviricetes sp.]
MGYHYGALFFFVYKLLKLEYITSTFINYFHV